MPMHVNTCSFERLAQSPVAKIDRCRDCGSLSIHLGATTLRVDAGAMRALTATLKEALIAMEGDPLRLPTMDGFPSRTRGSA